MNKVQAFEIKSSLKNKILKKNKENSSKTRNENYFMIFVNNGSCKSGTNNKREEVEQQINSLINEITTLIKDNRNTYENPSKLKEFEKRSSLRKRENQNNEPALAYIISSLNDRTIIYSYLSKYVADMVEKLPNVMACTEDHKLWNE